MHRVICLSVVTNELVGLYYICFS